MAKGRVEEFDWWDHRFSVFFGFIIFVSVCIHILAAILLPGGPLIKVRTALDGKLIHEYYREEGTLPFRVKYFDEDGYVIEERYDKNENGYFESVHYYSSELISETKVSIKDDGYYDLIRTYNDDEVVEKYDRNHDKAFEETRIMRGGLRVSEETDRNGDGYPEQRITYDEYGNVLSLELDNDSDGVVDMKYPRKDIRVGPARSTRRRKGTTHRRIARP